MKNYQTTTMRWQIGLMIFLFWLTMAAATNVYVAVPGGALPQEPYTNWDMAATNIEVALNAINTNNGAYVFVSNGTYYLTNQLTVGKGVILQSWHNGNMDKTTTVIHANNYAGKPVTNRCISIDHPAAVVAGFTLTGGSNSSGGGVYITTNGGAIINCVLISNSATTYGGGIYATDAAGVVSNCLIITNTSGWGGGGVFIDNTGAQSLTIGNCEVSSNTTVQLGGGLYMRGAKVTLENCVVYKNNVTGGHGGGIALRLLATARNCLVVGNRAYGGYGGGVYVWNGGYVGNCTIVGNSAPGWDKGGGLAGVASQDFWASNNIVYFNTTDGANSNFINAAENSGTWVNCCSAPNLNALRPGINISNITANPQFVNTNAFNYRLRMTSPCINAGTNQAWMMNAVDLGGGARIQNGIVDMGAYETYFWQGTVFSVR